MHPAGEKLRHPFVVVDCVWMPIVGGLLGQGAGVTEIANLTGLSRQTIYRIKADPAAQERAAAVWAA